MTPKSKLTPKLTPKPTSRYKTMADQQHYMMPPGYKEAGTNLPIPTNDCSRRESTLEVVPPSHLESYHGSYQTTVVNQQGWISPSEPGEKPQEKREILGLSVKVFWGIIILLVVILAAGIGGGLGAMAAQRSREFNAESQQQQQASPAADKSDNAITTTKPTPATTNKPTTTIQPAEGTSPAPVDGGCPDINGTAYMPLGNIGEGIGVDLYAQKQTFVRLCSTDLSAGP